MLLSIEDYASGIWFVQAFGSNIVQIFATLLLISEKNTSHANHNIGPEGF